MKYKLITYLILLIFSVPANTTEIGGVFSVRCQFTRSIATNFDKGTPETSTTTMPDIIFDKIDVNNKTARLIGSIGVETVSVINGHNNESIHLVEMTPSKNMTITTIYLNNPNVDFNQLPVVHSRHMFFNGPIPSQSLGTCTKLLD